MTNSRIVMRQSDLSTFQRLLLKKKFQDSLSSYSLPLIHREVLLLKKWPGFRSTPNMEAVAKHDFSATADDELSFRKNQVCPVKPLLSMSLF